MPDQASTSPAKGDVRSYAIRRVNAFPGVLQVIETGAGRTVSTNGAVWDIEIRAQREAEWGSLIRNTQQLDSRQRERMENSLNIQAASVEHHWQLYPEIIDEDRPTAARGQCRLEKVNHGGSTSQ